MQLQVPEVLAWEPEGPFEIKLELVNYSGMILMAVEPKVEASDVTIYRLDGTLICKTPRAVEKIYEKWTIRGFQPAQRWQVKRNLKENCPSLEPGYYRYEANYRMNFAEALRSLYVAHLGPQSGRILVKEGATAMKYEDLLVAVENPDSAQPSGAEPAVEPAAAPATATAPAATTAATEPAAKAEPAASTEPPPSPAEIRACIDKELNDRGLNAYGDAKGTTYDGNPPVDEYGRILYVASRNPAIRRACKVPRF